MESKNASRHHDLIAGGMVAVIGLLLLLLLYDGVKTGMQ